MRSCRARPRPSSGNCRLNRRQGDVDSAARGSTLVRRQRFTERDRQLLNGPTPDPALAHCASGNGIDGNCPPFATRKTRVSPNSGSCLPIHCNERRTSSVALRALGVSAFGAPQGWNGGGWHRYLSGPRGGHPTLVLAQPRVSATQKRFDGAAARLPASDEPLGGIS